LNFPPFMLDQLDGCSIGGGTGYTSFDSMSQDRI
jgi:hypothetical protein